MPDLYFGFRFPAEIIHAVWLYHCFSLSLVRPAQHSGIPPDRTLSSAHTDGDWLSLCTL